MSLSDRQKQVQKLQEKIEQGEDIDVTEEFDKLVDYLQNHGYEIVKRDYPKTSEEKIESYSEELFEADSPRTAVEVEKGIKNMAKRADVKPEDVMHIWQSQMKNLMERAAGSGRTSDFAELIEYIKAGHSITNQIQNDGWPV